MKPYRHSKSSLFMLELMLNILFFSILVTFCLQMFVKANQISERTLVLHQAVTVCTSMAEICQGTSSAEELLLRLFPDAQKAESSILFFYDESFSPCSEEHACYQAAYLPATDALKTASISFTKFGEEIPIYSLSFSAYVPAAHTASGGAPHE